MIARASRLESQSESGAIEVLENKTFDNEMGKGIFTHRLIYIARQLPEWVQRILPGKALQVEEKSWNLYPYSKTVYYIRTVLGMQMTVTAESRHKADTGQTENIHNLKADSLSRRKVEWMDIAYDEIPSRYTQILEDARSFESTKTNRGPLKRNWKDSVTPIMCAYKLVRVEFNLKQRTLRTKSIDLAHEVIRSYYLKNHVQAYCWIDEWIHLSTEEILSFDNGVITRLNENFRKKSATESKWSTRLLKKKSTGETNTKKKLIAKL